MPLKARNITARFLDIQIGGVDDNTWLSRLKRGLDNHIEQKIS